MRHILESTKPFSSIFSVWVLLSPFGRKKKNQHIGPNSYIKKSQVFFFLMEKSPIKVHTIYQNWVQEVLKSNDNKI